jgi:hypothetical protein
MTEAITSTDKLAISERDIEKHSNASHGLGFWLLFALYLTVSAVAFAAAFYYQQGHDYWLAAQTLAFDLGGAIYLVYTHETIRLRTTAESQVGISLRQSRTSQQQLEVSQDQLRVSNAQIALLTEQSENAVRPLVVAVPSNEANLITLKNFGNGSAVNVRLLPSSTGDESGITFTLKFPIGVSALGPGETATVKVEQWFDDLHSPESVVDLRPEKRDITVEIGIEYSSTHFHQYRTRMYLARTGYEIQQLTDTPPSPEVLV